MKHKYRLSQALLFTALAFGANASEIPVNGRASGFSEPPPSIVKINPDIQGISYFSCSVRGTPGSLSIDDCNEINANRGMLNATTDLNKNGVRERLRSGIFLYKDGTTGTFLEITEGSYTQFLLSIDYQRYSVIVNVRGKAAWSMCFNCGNFAFLAWDGRKFIGDWGEWE